MEYVLNLAEVTLRRSGNTLLDAVTWQVRDGERWVVLGPNGAGKTSLLRVTATLAHPTEGLAQILGEELGAVDTAELRPRIGLSSATLADQLSPDAAALDVVLTAAWGMTGRWRESYDPADTARATELLAQFGVESLAARTFGTLSEGERKRVLIARALMSDPELLLLDEPAAGLDLGAREDLVSRLGALAQDPLSPVTILVTHHVEEIPPGFTHALLLRNGQVVDCGPLDEVLVDAALSETFGLPLSIRQWGPRWSARITNEPTPRG